MVYHNGEYLVTRRDFFCLPLTNTGQTRTKVAQQQGNQEKNPSVETLIGQASELYLAIPENIAARCDVPYCARDRAAANSKTQI